MATWFAIFELTDVNYCVRVAAIPEAARLLWLANLPHPSNARALAASILSLHQTINNRYLGKRLKFSSDDPLRF